MFNAIYCCLVVLLSKYGIPLSKLAQLNQQTLVVSPVKYGGDSSDEYWTTRYDCVRCEVRDLCVAVAL